MRCALSTRSTEFSAAIRKHVDVVHHEIQDAESAISQLADKDMSFALDSKQKIQGMLDDLEAMNRHTLKVIHELDRLSLEVGQGVDAAVTALQFQDMGSQLLGQMRKHHARLGAFALGLGALEARLRQEWPGTGRTGGRGTAPALAQPGEPEQRQRGRSGIVLRGIDSQSRLTG